MLPSQRALFDIPGEVCFLNAASYSPLPLATLEAGRSAVARKGRPWLINDEFAARQHERARNAAARLIDADPQDVALISSVAYGVAAAAKILPMPAGARVLVLQDDHSSRGAGMDDAGRRGRLHRGDGARVPATAIGRQRCSRRSIAPARRRSRSRPSPRCTGPMAAPWISAAGCPRCARMAQRC